MTDFLNEDLSRRKWRVILKALERAADTAEKSPRRRAELSVDILQALAQGVDNALKGFPVAAWREKNPDDRRPRELFAFDQKGLAVAYVLAAREGIVGDPTPVKTAQEALKLTGQKGLYSDAPSTRTIHDWVQAELQNPGFATNFVKSARKYMERFKKEPPLGLFFRDLQ